MAKHLIKDFKEEIMKYKNTNDRQILILCMKTFQ